MTTPNTTLTLQTLQCLVKCGSWVATLGITLAIIGLLGEATQPERSDNMKKVNLALIGLGMFGTSLGCGMVSYVQKHGDEHPSNTFEV